MTRQSLRTEIERACREILPARPIYVAFESEAPADLICPDALAYCARHLDVALRDTIGDRWEGHGPAILINDRAAWRYVKQSGRMGRAFFHWRFEIVATLIHELAHIALRPNLPTELDNDPDRAVRMTQVLRSVVAEPDTPAISKPCPWAGHDGQFVRVAQHIGHRLRAALDFWQSTDCLHLDAYGLSAEWRYQSALGNEPERLAGVPLTELATIAPPEKFIDLWRSDVRAWWLALQSPSDLQSVAMMQGLELFSKITNSPAVLADREAST